MVKIVRLKRGVKLGNLRPTLYSKWIYDDGGAEPGEEVLIETYERKIIGIGVYDGVGPISVRILDYQPDRPIRDVIKRNILRAYSIRRRFGWDAYRLVNSDADMLPGLIIDIYRETAVIQSGSLGLDTYLHYIAEILDRYGIASRSYVRNDQRSRREVGLDIWKDWIYGVGDVDILISEGEARFKVNIEEGHKTGFFLDQRLNRLESRLYSRDTYALDLYSYTGGFGIHALLNGARKVRFVERDKRALEYLEENIKLNGLGNREYEVVGEDVYKFLENDSEKYSFISVDPNALIQRREEVSTGIERYRDLYTKAYNRLEKGGVIFLSSCSYFLKPEKYIEIIRNLNPKPLILGRMKGASPDHPYMQNTPELQYLKAIYLSKT